MVTNLLRLTTEYVDIEDRIRMSGVTPEGVPAVLWLTGRLASRAVPEFLRWLAEAEPPPPAAVASPVAKQAVQSFVQAAAVAELKPQAPVTPRPSAPAWLVKAIDLQASKTHLDMTLRGDPGQAASLRFNALEMRQWLAILHAAWSKAGWPPLVWPGWITSEPPAPKDLVRH